MFLGEDLMHTRDYSDETARVIDEEVERILREEEGPARKLLQEHRLGLDAVALALLEHRDDRRARRSPAWSTRRWATRPAGSGGSATPTGR